MSQSYEIDMCHGPLFGKIIRFSIPLMLSGILQLLFNAADIIVVGRFVGSTALAAVGSTSSLINLLINLFIGFSVGANVLVARFHGAGRDDEVNETVHTAITLSMISGIFLLILGVTVTRTLLIWMGSPDDVLDQSSLYLKIYFLAMPATLLYNFGSSILRAVGDTKRPLFFLIISGVLNAGLNLFLVVVFHMGVAGVAYATIISQFMSAFLCLYRLMKKSPEEYTVSLRDVRLDSYMLKQIVSNGLPAGVQNSVIAIANVVVQSNINSFGKLAVAGCGAYSKVEGFGFLPITCFSMGLTTFISQNLGAKKYDRAKKGARIGILCSISMAEIVGIIVYFASPVFIAAFNNDPKVIAFGVKEAHIITLFYFLLAFSHCIAGLMRGAGRATVPMFVMLGCWCVIRVTYITIAVKLHPVIQTVFWAYPLTWSLSSILFLIFYLKSDWIHGFEKKRN